ncbi:DUF6973 domain-containing protein [Isoptericola croceus]|uniref:DUF6973 domain-containing protein n=1 Tax=Isoptericola croceus TaxID=3031406 RepID=UPI0023FA417A|nr:hypothetical protein [Isoptericola croceus]
MLYGSDTEALRRLGELLEQRAEALDDQVTAIGDQVQGVPWFGPSSEMFVEEWWSLHRPGMQAAAAGLRTAGAAAMRNAEAQETTSSDLGGSGSTGGSSAGTGGSGSGSAGGSGAESTGPAPHAFVTTAGDGSGSGSGSDGGGDAPRPGPVPLEDRRPTEEILEEYQVSDAEMVDWKPSGPGVWLADKLGQVDLDEMAPRTITEKEAEMLDDLSIFGKKDFEEIHDLAFDEADNRFETENRNDDHNDAFRHAYWSALMADEFGVEWSHDFGTAHEQIPGNNAAREAMDLYNNEVGRQIADANPGASRQELADLVEQAVHDGEMVVVGPDGSLVYSDQIAWHETGDADGPAAPGQDPQWQDES